MKKLLLIGLNDARLAFRDRTAMIMMLLTPFLLTLGLGFVTGRFSANPSRGLNPISVLIVNQDAGRLGQALVDVFQSKDLGSLVQASLMDDPAAAHRAVDGNQAGAAVIIPEGFTASLSLTAGAASPPAVVPVELYANPTTPTSAAVVGDILQQFLAQVEVRRVGGQVIIAQLIASGRIRSQDAAQIGQRLNLPLASSSENGTSISLAQARPAGTPVAFDPLAFIAPAMALMFLMYTASYGGRVLLNERAQGTLPRLLVSPTTVTQVLGGKVFGTFLTGLAQVLILILASTLLFQLKWGDPVAVLALAVAAVFAAVGWGLVITALAKTATQVLTVGAALMLLFGLLGGTFFSLNGTPGWFQMLSKITPNAWGGAGFTTLAMGGRLNDILAPIGMLLAMGAGLFVVAVVRLSRRGVMEP